jgi:ubiquitin-conjugating enzyme E2 O
MLAKLTRIPFFQHFEEFVVGHFRKYGHKVLRGCKAYMDGAQVGCLVGDGVQDVDEGDKSSDNFKASLKKLFVVLQTEFTNIGVYCNEFENHGATKARADITLRL